MSAERQSSPARRLTVGIDGRFLQDKFDGVGRYLHGLLLGLLDLDEDICLRLFVDHSLPNSRFPLAALEDADRLELTPISTPLYSARELWEWPRTLRGSGIDVFHSPYFWSPVRLPCPLVSTVHDMIFDRYPQYIPGLHFLLPYKIASQVMMRRSRRILAVSEATARDITKFGGRRLEGRTRAVPNGVDASFQPVPDPIARQRVRRRYGLPERFVLALGTRRPHKNIERLIAAYARIAGRVPHSLVLAGSVDERFPHRLEETGRRLIEEGRIVETRRIDEQDLPTLLSSAELFVQPSIIEGFGLPALEAMACGCPVAGSNTSSLPEVLGNAGLTFDPLSEPEIAATLERALRSADLRAQLRLRGLRRAATFTWRAAAASTLEVYRSAVGRPWAAASEVKAVSSAGMQ